jgi:hypothetical protein
MNDPLKNPLSEEMRLLANQMNPEERQNLRKTPAWESCFNAWLECETPSVIQRKILLDPGLKPGAEEEFLRWMDGKAIVLFSAQLKGADEVETMQELFPYPEDWEDREDEVVPGPLREAAQEFLSRVTGNE